MARRTARVTMPPMGDSWFFILVFGIIAAIILLSVGAVREYKNHPERRGQGVIIAVLVVIAFLLALNLLF